ncbi:hypothetical protein RFI_07301, partial [Reticulomyxa filosa]
MTGCVKGEMKIKSLKEYHFTPKYLSWCPQIHLKMQNYIINLKTFSRPTIASTTNNVSFVLTRYYTFPKKMEPDTMRPIIFVLLRLLYHLLLLARNEEHSKDREKIRQLVKQPNASDVTKFLWDKTKRDFKRLQ